MKQLNHGIIIAENDILTLNELVEDLWPLDENLVKIPQSEFTNIDWKSSPIKNKVKLDLSFQSVFRWKMKEQISFLVSVTMGRATSSIIFADVELCLLAAKAFKDDPNWKETIDYFQELTDEGYTRVVIDGNNRDITFIQFVGNMIALPAGTYEDIHGIRGPWTYNKPTKWNDLHPVHRDLLGITNINITVVKKAQRRGLSDYFNEINKQNTLNNQEIRNSWYCRLAGLIRDYGDEYEDLFKEKKFIGMKVHRRAHEELLAGWAVLSNHQTFGVSLEKKQFDDAYGNNLPNEFETEESQNFFSKSVPLMDTTLELLSYFPANKHAKSVLVDVFNFVKQYQETHDFVDMRGLGERLSIVIENLKKSTDKVHNTKDTNEHLTFSALQRMSFVDHIMEARFDLIIDGLFNENSSVNKNGTFFIDPNSLLKLKSKEFFEEKSVSITEGERLYTPKQKFELWLKQAKKEQVLLDDGVTTTERLVSRCTKTDREIPLSEYMDSTKWQADHIIEVADGGETTIENGQLIAVDAHSEKTVENQRRRLQEKRDKIKSSLENHFQEEVAA